MKKLVLLLIALTISVPAIPQPTTGKTHGPDCAGAWPTTMTLVHLKNAGLINAKQIDATKTGTTRLASEKIGSDLWHQVYLHRQPSVR